MENDGSLTRTQEFATFPYSELHASTLPNRVCNVRRILTIWRLTATLVVAPHR
jgi:hypothetical protein